MQGDLPVKQKQNKDMCNLNTNYSFGVAPFLRFNTKKYWIYRLYILTPTAQLESNIMFNVFLYYGINTQPNPQCLYQNFSKKYAIYSIQWNSHCIIIRFWFSINDLVFQHYCKAVRKIIACPSIL